MQPPPIPLSPPPTPLASMSSSFSSSRFPHPVPSVLSDRPAPSPISRLASVEVQLSLQYLDSQSRIAAARCARSLLADASNALAWKHASLLPLHLDHFLTRPPALSRLLLHSSFSLRMHDLPRGPSGVA